MWASLWPITPTDTFEYDLEPDLAGTALRFRWWSEYPRDAEGVVTTRHILNRYFGSDLRGWFRRNLCATVVFCQAWDPINQVGPHHSRLETPQSSMLLCGAGSPNGREQKWAGQLQGIEVACVDLQHRWGGSRTGSRGRRRTLSQYGISSSVRGGSARSMKRVRRRSGSPRCSDQPGC